MILRHLEVGPLAVNCYIVGDPASRQGVIIDPGENYKDILDAVSESGLDIQCIIATHGHFDHNGAVAGLKREYGEKVPFLLHKGDHFFIPDSKASAKRWGFDIEQVPEPDRFITDGEYIKLGGSSQCPVEEANGGLPVGRNEDDSVNQNIEKESIHVDKEHNVDKPSITRVAQKNYNAGLELKIIHTPGHSPGGISIYLTTEGVLFSGDTLFQHSVGRTDFRKSSFDDLKASIRGRLYALPDDTTVYPGHGPSTTIGQEKQHNMVVPERDRAAWFRG